MGSEQEELLKKQQREFEVQQAARAYDYLRTNSAAEGAIQLVSAEGTSVMTQKTDEDYLRELLYGSYPDGAAYEKSYPIAPPPAPAPEELACLSLSEKKAKQEQYQNALAVHEQRSMIWTRLVQQREREDASRQNRENMRIQEEIDAALLVQQQSMMSGNSELTAALSAFREKTDEAEKKADMKNILTLATQVLLDDPNMKKEVTERRAVEETTNGPISLKIAATEHLCYNPNEFEAFIAIVDQHEKNMRPISMKNQYIQIMDMEAKLAVGFTEEEMNLAEEVIDEIRTEFGEEIAAVYDAFGETVSAGKELMGLSDEELNRYASSSRQKDYRLCKAKLMKDQHLSEDEADAMVLDALRKKFFCEEYINLSENIEGNKLTADMWDKTGGATYHMEMPEKEANEIVEKSGGFMCSVESPYNKALHLKELRSSLPEEAVIEGRTIHLRQSYNTFVKNLMEILLDKDGHVTDDGLEWARNGNVGMGLSGQKLFSSPFRERFDSTALSEIEHVIQAVGHLQDGMLFKEIYIDAIMSKIRYSDSLAAGDEETINELTTELRQQRVPVTDEKGNAQYGADGKLLTREPTEKEMQDAITECIQETDTIRRRCMEIRNMDANRPDIPIINACSANANFYEQIKRAIDYNASGMDEAKVLNRRCSYGLVNHYAEVVPQEALTKLLDNFERQVLAHHDSEDAFISSFRQVMAAQTSIQMQDLTEDQKQEQMKYYDFSGMTTMKDIKEYLRSYLNLIRTDAPADVKNEAKEKNDIIRKKGKMIFDYCFTFMKKYDYHQAAAMAKKDGMMYTVEGFASEPVQYMVEPFTFHCAIGKYRDEGKEPTTEPEGFAEYYRLDDPLAISVTGILKSWIKSNVKY